jgi:hypothetical protein
MIPLRDLIQIPSLPEIKMKKNMVIPSRELVYKELKVLLVNAFKQF